MKNIFRVEWISALLTLVFVYTGLSKWNEHDLFEAQLHVYPFISNASSWLSWAIPAGELCTAVLLLIPKYTLKGLYLSLVLLTLFTLYLALMIITQNTLPCSCGGVIEQMSWQQHLVFNIILVILTLLAIWNYQTKYRNGITQKAVASEKY